MALGFDTAGSLINDAAVQCGLTAVTDPYASTDANFILLRTLLKRVGSDLWSAKEGGWSWFQQSTSFVTVQGTNNYALPADFGGMQDQSGWNRTNRLPLGGPLSPQEWQYLKARLVGVVFTVLFRPMQQRIYLYPDTDTPGGYTIAYEYLSRYWAQPYGQTSATLEAPTAATDTVLFDREVVIAGLEKEFLAKRGFDTTKVDADYEARLAACLAKDAAAPILRLNNRDEWVEPLLGQQNVPFTGFGS